MRFKKKFPSLEMRVATHPITASLSQTTDKKPCDSFMWPNQPTAVSSFLTPQPQRASYPTQMETLHCTGATDPVHLCTD